MTNKTLKKGPLIVISNILVIYSVLAIVYVILVKNNVTSETYTHISEVTKQGVKIVNNQIDGELKVVQTLARAMQGYSGFDKNDTLALLNRETKGNSFKKMGIILPNGISMVTDGYYGNLSDRGYFKNAIQGKTTISKTLIDRVDNGYINVYSTPIYDNNKKIKAVLFAAHNTSVFKELLSVSFFGGEGYSYIIEKDGTAAVTSNHDNSMKDFKNIFDFINCDSVLGKRYVDEFKKNLTLGVSGSIIYRKDGIKRYMGYEPMGKNDWYIATVVPYSVILNKGNYIIKSVATISMVTIIVFAYLLVHIFMVHRKSKKILEEMAFKDSLTGYPNWNRFTIDCKRVLRESAEEYALVLLDVDKFKLINDLFGKKEGNKTLVYISKTIQGTLEKEELFSRLYNDTFAILIKYNSKDYIIDKIHRIEGYIKNYHGRYKILLSFGIYLITDKSLDINILTDRAGLAKKTIKSKTDVTYAFYSDEIRDKILKEKEIENNMELALQNREFKVYLQPKYNLQDESLFGAEALVRWSIGDNTLMQPNDFIPLFEKNGFIKKLDMYIFERVCEFLSDFKSKNKNQRVPTISINLSRLHLSDARIAEKLESISNEYNIQTTNIEIELTESVVFNNETQLISIMKSLRDVGFKISIDDFGSGYSSLSLLKDLPADILKLDKAFLDKASDIRGKKIVENIINMSKDLNLSTIAEGVETWDQVQFLKSIGCDLAQGYYYAKPMPMEKFLDIYF